MVPPLKIGNSDNGQRLDAILARTYPQYSRSFFQKFLKKGGVTLSGTPREPDYRVHVGETFQVSDFDHFAENTKYEPSKGPKVDFEPTIVFEDAACLVIDKPAGLVVHPAPGHRVGTLMDWLKNHLGAKVVRVFTDPERLGLIHRLDKDTSGVLIIAKSILAQTAISRQFRDRTVKKTYVAFVEGVPSAKSGVIDAPVGRSRKAPTRMAISPLGRASETAFEVKEALKEVSLVSLHPKTGRTHQIRVHLSAIGHPIVGDRTYGAKSVWGQTYDIQRPLLHAERLQLEHPTSGKAVEFHAPWPKDFKRAQTIFRQAFKVLCIASVTSFWAMSALSAQETAAKSTTPKTSAAAPRSGALSSDVRKLKAEVATLRDEIDSLQAKLDKLNAGDRLRDMERAALDLNAKAAGTSAMAEETKTQMLDLSRKVKAQQEAIEQMKDQLGRLQQQSVRVQASESATVVTETSEEPTATGTSTTAAAAPSSPSPTRRPCGARQPQ